MTRQPFLRAERTALLTTPSCLKHGMIAVTDIPCTECRCWCGVVSFVMMRMKQILEVRELVFPQMEWVPRVLSYIRGRAEKPSSLGENRMKILKDGLQVILCHVLNEFSRDTALKLSE